MKQKQAAELARTMRKPFRVAILALGGPHCIRFSRKTTDGKTVSDYENFDQGDCMDTAAALRKWADDLEAKE